MHAKIDQSMKKVVLVIGNRFQPNSCGFIKEFEEKGGKIDGIICVQPKRGLKYYAKIPFRILKKLKPSRIKQYVKSSIAQISGMQQMQALKGSWNNLGENSWDVLDGKFDIAKYAAEKNIPLHYHPFISSEVISTFTKDGPTLFPMYAGGILSKELLSDKNAEFLNAHMGEMPRYRGMNVIEWAVLEKQPPKVAVMVMNEKIDGGDVIWHKDIPLVKEKTIREIRTTGYTYCYKAMAEGIYEYLHNEQLRTVQPKGARYYYRMHGKIKELTLQQLQLQPAF